MKLPFVRSKALRTGAAHLYPASVALQDNFSFKTKYEEDVFLFKETKEGILVPRQCGTPGEDKTSKGHAIHVKSSFVPRDAEQEMLVNKSYELAAGGRSHILEAPTGKGKTIMGSEIAGRLGRTTGIIVPKSDLIKQWREALQKLFGLKASQIGLVKGDTCLVAGKPFVIMMVHSICKEARYPNWIYKEFGTLLIDECHTMSANTFSEAMWKFTAKTRIGLTATAYRLDGKDFVFKAHIGRVDVVAEDLPLTPKVLIRKSSWQVPTITSIDTDERGRKLIRKKKLHHQAGKTMHVHKILASSEARNNVIVDFMKQAYRAGRRQIFFSELKEDHLGRIEPMLIAAGIPKRDIAWYVGGMKQSELDAASRKKIILATYRMVSMGTNIPWLDTCILGTPRSDVVQIVGRILREYDDKKTPLVFDVVDEDSPVFQGYYRKRLAWYRNKGADIKIVEGKKS